MIITVIRYNENMPSTQRPGYLKRHPLHEAGRPQGACACNYMSPRLLYQRWEENPCTTPWLFQYPGGWPHGATPMIDQESCQAYQAYNLGQWITSPSDQCVLGKELSPADVCKPNLNLCERGYDWLTEVGCVKRELRT